MFSFKLKKCFDHCINSLPTIALILVLLFPSGCSKEKNPWTAAEGPLKTRWTDEVGPNNSLPEYPRPQMIRKEWLNLNGLWEFAINKKSDRIPEDFPDRILVPYPVESALSGVKKRPDETERIWYRRRFKLPKKWRGPRILLHFGAVDWEAVVTVNGKEVGAHRGGYDSFSFDISDFMESNQDQELVVSVWDPSDQGDQPVGKQRKNPQGIFYTPTSGIWQTVWLEPVPQTSIQQIKLVPHLFEESLDLFITSNKNIQNHTIKAVAMAEGNEVGEVIGNPNEKLTLKLEGVHPWTPDSPFLYDLQLFLISPEGETLDLIDSYFGLRDISIGPDKDGITRLMLNDQFIFQLGPLDQGFWPDGLYTAPTDEALIYDIKFMKDMGFNMVRKHVKVEPDRWYYWCDKLGLMVWQDMPNGKNTTADDREQFELELKNVIQGLFCHPSIIMWVPFNEGWGQYDSERITDWLKELDPSRLVNHASGWHDRKVSDVHDIHSYPDPRSPEPEPHRAAVLGEFGGLGFNVADHSWEQEGWGYDLLEDQESLAVRYEGLFQDLLPMIKDPGLSAAVYTQISDIETENNGLMTYDREINKIDPAFASIVHQGYFSPTITYPSDIFVETVDVGFHLEQPDAKIHYTLDGTEPTQESAVYDKPIRINEDTAIKVCAFWENGIQSRTASYTLKKELPRVSENIKDPLPGIQMEIYEGQWDNLPVFEELTSVGTKVVNEINLKSLERKENFGLEFQGFLSVHETGVYIFYNISDDGSRLFIGDRIVVENDGIHGYQEKQGAVALEAGIHSFTLLYFQKRGGLGLDLQYQGPGIKKQSIPEKALLSIR